MQDEIIDRREMEILGRIFGLVMLSVGWGCLLVTAICHSECPEGFSEWWRCYLLGGDAIAIGAFWRWTARIDQRKDAHANSQAG